MPAALAWSEANGLSELEHTTAAERLVEQARMKSLLRSVPQIQCRVSNNRMETPVEHPPLPVPPDWVQTLSSEQTDLIGNLETALLRQRNPTVAGQALSKMKAADIPKPALANAEFGILMLEAAQSSAAETSVKLIDFARTYPESSSSSGTPLADLALIQALRSNSIEASRESLRKEVFRRVIQRPSFLTSEIIAASKPLGPEIVQALEIIWQAQEKARTALNIAMKVPPDASLETAEIWVQNHDQHIFIQRHTQDGNDKYSATLIPGKSWKGRLSMHGKQPAIRFLPIYHRRWQLEVEAGWWFRTDRPNPFRKFPYWRHGRVNFTHLSIEIPHSIYQMKA
ncbi:MAG: hypothetical protein P8Y80_15610 [Acidobacteriota bacterium]